jgi:hypothetical protein
MDMAVTEARTEAVPARTLPTPPPQFEVEPAPQAAPSKAKAARSANVPAIIVAL